MTWRSIESAPRDGTKIFIWWPGCVAAPLASWEFYSWAGDCMENPDDPEAPVYAWAVDDWAVSTEHGDGWLYLDEDPEPTLWIPAPAGQDVQNGEPSHGP